MWGQEWVVDQDSGRLLRPFNPLLGGGSGPMLAKGPEKGHCLERTKQKPRLRQPLSCRMALGKGLWCKQAPTVISSVFDSWKSSSCFRSVPWLEMCRAVSKHSFQCPKAKVILVHSRQETDAFTSPWFSGELALFFLVVTHTLNRQKWSRRSTCVCPWFACPHDLRARRLVWREVHCGSLTGLALSSILILDFHSQSDESLSNPRTSSWLPARTDSASEVVPKHSSSHSKAIPSHGLVLSQHWEGQRTIACVTGLSPTL